VGSAPAISDIVPSPHQGNRRQAENVSPLAVQDGLPGRLAAIGRSKRLVATIYPPVLAAWRRIVQSADVNVAAVEQRADARNQLLEHRLMISRIGDVS